MSKALDRLIDVMAKLRNPDGGCPWDLEQDFKSIAPHTLEETYEVVEAIESGDAQAMKDELGDLLFQIVFHAQMAREKNMFDIDQIADHVTDKMIERHPHVFGDRDVNTATGVVTNWENDKAKKREAAAAAKGEILSALDGVSTALPASTRAVKLQNRAARVGFDWPEARDIIAKIREEIDELKAEIDTKDNLDAIEDEFGDVFFAVINLARRLKVDPETALRRTNRKFEHRFRGIEQKLNAKGRNIKDASLDEMETLWNEVKKEERAKKQSQEK